MVRLENRVIFKSIIQGFTIVIVSNMITIVKPCFLMLRSSEYEVLKVRFFPGGAIVNFSIYGFLNTAPIRVAHIWEKRDMKIWEKIKN